MKKVADVVLQLLEHDETALESFREGFLNLSAYAQKIHENVEKLTYKSVKKGTIIVALSRLSRSELKLAVKQRVQISHLSTRSPVTSFTYQKTSDTERRVSTLNPYLVTSSDLFGIIEGESEIVIIASEKAVDLIKDHIGVIPRKEIPDLVAVTAQFPESLNDIHKALNSLLSILIIHKVNVVNVIPASNEISFILDKNNLEQAISAFSLFTKKETKQ